MSTRVRRAVAPVLVLVAMLGLELLGLRSGRAAIVVVGVVAVIALWVVVLRMSLEWAGVVAACGASFTLTWNGWFLGPVRPGDLLILLALACLVLAHPDAGLGTPPWWVKQLIFVVTVGVLIQIFFPPSYGYLAQRLSINAGGARVTPRTGNLALTNIGVGLKFVIAVAVIPMAFVGAVRVERRALHWLALCFAAGTALSGWVAIADHFGANIGEVLTRVPNVSNRQLGFSDHPNFLAAGIVIALPFAYYFAFSPVRWERVVGFVSLGGMVLGVYASGSRGGAVCVLIALAVCVVLHPRTRVYTVNFALGGLVIAGVLAVVFPAFGTAILRVTRLTSSPVTQGSDTVRQLAASQGWQDFHHSWFSGIGLQASTDASQVYLQELASGGLLLFLGMSVYLLGGVLASFRLMMDHSVIAAMVLASLITTIALNFVETDLTDRFYYLPAAILIALLDIRRRQPAAEIEEPAPVPVAAGTEL